MNEVEIFRGFIDVRDYAEEYDVLFIGNSDDPFAEEMEEYKDEIVSVKYWTSIEEKSREDLVLGHITYTCGGSVDAKYIGHYSDITGYMWTDEELNIGGHNLLDELKTHVGKFIHLEIIKH